MRASGTYYDGVTSKRHSVILAVAGDRLRITGDAVETVWPLHEIRLSDPLGSMQRSATGPAGDRCDFTDGALARRIEQAQGKGGFFTGVHRWENSLKRAILALVVTVLLVVGFIRFGIPMLAERAAVTIPPEMEISLGTESLQVFDRALFRPSELDAARRSELEQLFTGVVAALDATERPYRIELRSAPGIGANAFALPGGIVILTDELVRMAASDEEIASVLAHEVGHVRHRHAMRQVIQGSAVGLIVATLTGDVFSATSMAATLPTMLVDAKFSRDMEREADDVALEYLQRTGGSVEHFTAILLRMQEAYAKKYGRGADESGPANYFSSHPATQERIERLCQ